MSYIRGVGLVVIWTSCFLEPTTPYFRIRSQSQDTARELAGWTKETHLYRPRPEKSKWFRLFRRRLKKDDWYGTFASTFEYTDSFNSDDLVKCLFSSHCLEDCALSKIVISGSRVPNRDKNDWLADYFGLPTDFSSRVSLSPRIQNYLTNWSVYLGLDNWTNGLFFKAHAPLVHTKWSLNFRETVLDPGELGYDEGYFTGAPLPRNALVDNFTEFVTGARVPDVKRGLQLYQAFLGFEITSEDAITFESLKCSKWADTCCERSSETRLSDVHLALGNNFYNSKKARLGASIQLVVPTGNRPTGEFFFEPIVGNGHHWELGIGVTGDWIPWRGCGKSRLGIYFEGVVTHLFKDTQCRVFDLKSGCNSRYMLALKMGTPVEELFAHPNPAVENGAVAPSAQFISIFSPVANLTKQRANVSIDVQADLTAMFSYSNKSGNFTLDVGYNFWVQSCENITLTDCDVCTNPLADGKTWALKGDSQVFGYTNIVPPCVGPCPIITPTLFGSVIPLSPSQQCATIHTGLNNFVGPSPDDGGIDGIRPTRNPGVDNAEFAQTTSSASDALQILDRFAPDSDGLPTKTSNNPVFLTIDDIDVCGARKKKMSHKLFGALSYRWPGCCEKKRYIPYISLGGKVELGRTSSKSCRAFCSILDPPCNPPDPPWNNQVVSGAACNYCTLSEWGLWLKGGISF